jgi:hypothetical protein
MATVKGWAEPERSEDRLPSGSPKGGATATSKSKFLSVKLLSVSVEYGGRAVVDTILADLREDEGGLYGLIQAVVTSKSFLQNYCNVSKIPIQMIYGRFAGKWVTQLCARPTGTFAEV